MGLFTQAVGLEYKSEIKLQHAIQTQFASTQRKSTFADTTKFWCELDSTLIEILVRQLSETFRGVQVLE